MPDPGQGRDLVPSPGPVASARPQPRGLPPTAVASASGEEAQRPSRAAAGAPGPERGRGGEAGGLVRRPGDRGPVPIRPWHLPGLEERIDAPGSGSQFCDREEWHQLLAESAGQVAAQLRQHGPFLGRERLAAPPPQHRPQLRLDGEAESVVYAVYPSIGEGEQVAGLAVGVVEDRVEDRDTPQRRIVRPDQLVGGTISQPLASDRVWAATSRQASVPSGKSYRGRSPRIGL